MRIINADQLFRHMDSHNWHSMTRDQLESFVQDLDLNQLDEYPFGFLDALDEVKRQCSEIRKAMMNAVQICKTCRWWAPTEEVCCCEKSNHCADFTVGFESCECWERDKRDAR